MYTFIDAIPDPVRF
jgi:tryptophan synthase